MKTTFLATIGLLTAWASFATTCHAQEMPEMPKPTKEHALLEQFAGEWTSECEMTMAPGAEPMVCTGTEAARMVGGFWLVAVGKAEVAGMPGESMITLGYDPAKKKYVGTFVCSAQDYLWEYEGEFDAEGKKLVLLTEGPSMTDPTKKAMYQETLELVDEDHKVFTSSIEGPDCKWQPMATVNYVRVK